MQQTYGTPNRDTYRGRIAMTRQAFQDANPAWESRGKSLAEKVGAMLTKCNALRFGPTISEISKALEIEAAETFNAVRALEARGMAVLDLSTGSVTLARPGT